MCAQQHKSWLLSLFGCFVFGVAGFTAPEAEKRERAARQAGQSAYGQGEQAGYWADNDNGPPITGAAKRAHVPYVLGRGMRGGCGRGNEKCLFV